MAEDYIQFQPRQMLGKGSFGEVEKLRHKSDEAKVVACKAISYVDRKTTDDRSRESNKEAVHREIDILGKLKHDNIVGYVDFVLDEPNHKAFLYMEFCAGGSMQDFITKKQVSGPGASKEYPSEFFVWKVLLQLASGLMYCHHGVFTTAAAPRIAHPQTKMEGDWPKILHRDIKPGNIFFAQKLTDDESDPIAKLGDFGLGAVLEDGKAPETYVGTGIYLAPEINTSANDRIEWSEFCDIFSLGCTVYHLCSLEQPFDYHMDARKVNAERELGEAKEKFKAAPFSEDLKSIAQRCLAFDPHSRPTAIDIQNMADQHLRNLDPNRQSQTLVAHRTGLLPNTPIAATNLGGWQYRVYFQEASGEIREARHDAGQWTGGDSKAVICQAKLFSPLAVISSDEGNHKVIHVFYLSNDNILQEHICTDGSWRPGPLNKLKVKVSEYSRITAVKLLNGIRLYFQDLQNTLQEYVYEKPQQPTPAQQPPKSISCMPLRQLFKKKSTAKWRMGETLQADPVQGTCLAAATWGGESIRLYYQDSGLELREHCLDSSNNWYVGHMAIGVIPKQSPISAFAWSGSYTGINIRIYWQDADRQLCELAWEGGWRPPRRVTYMGNTQFSAVQWDNGQHIRAYYQGSDRRIMEKCQESGGIWYNGSRVDAP